MIDFSKLRQTNQTPSSFDPFEIFRRLPKAPGINDLWSSQADALRDWYERRDEQDIVIKLNTGGGKTLVGLLMARSTALETGGPVLYLCPTRQLQQQILNQAHQYGIDAVPYSRGGGIPLHQDFLSGRAVMVATYEALFNGRTKFGLRGNPRIPTDLAAIVLDDAHTSFAKMRDIFSLSIERDTHSDVYDTITTVFRPSILKEGRQGTLDDIISGKDNSILEIPYPEWQARSNEVTKLLADHVAGDNTAGFAWPLVRDSIGQCHALMSTAALTITPLYPDLSLFPSFADSDRRIYMSATVADDSSIVRTFNADPVSVSDPISPTSVAGVGERMLLVPDLTSIDSAETYSFAKSLAAEVAKKAGCLILTTSQVRAQEWSPTARVVSGDEVAEAVSSLVERTDNGPFAFPNRYDGLDLPGDSCRLLILDGIPGGTTTYELFRSAVLQGSTSISAAVAERVEQGIGRGTRGAGDHCVVLMLGRDLAAWVSKRANLDLLTPATQAQLHVGMTVSRNLASSEELADTVGQCLARSPDWITFHAEEIAEAAHARAVSKAAIDLAHVERQYFALLSKGLASKAASKLEKYVYEHQELEPRHKGWLLELAARALLEIDPARSIRLQKDAFALNHNLHRPHSSPDYTRPSTPSKQAETIVDRTLDYAIHKGPIVDLERIGALLSATATSNQFEQALKELGEVLGFSSERPEKDTGLGPDVLWILPHASGAKAWVLEAKSRKNADAELNKDDQGQLLQACEWFEERYPDLPFRRVVVHPNHFATGSVTVGTTEALTLAKLDEMIGSLRLLLQEVTRDLSDKAEAVRRCESRLIDLRLTPEVIEQHFLRPFQIRGK